MFCASFENLGAVLDEASEGSETSSRADHDDGGTVWLKGETEVFGRGFDGDVDGVAGREGAEVGAGGAEEAAVVGAAGVDYAVGDCAVGWGGERG